MGMLAGICRTLEVDGGMSRGYINRVAGFTSCMIKGIREGERESSERERERETETELRNTRLRRRGPPCRLHSHYPPEKFTCPKNNKVVQLAWWPELGAFRCVGHLGESESFRGLGLL